MDLDRLFSNTSCLLHHMKIELQSTVPKQLIYCVDVYILNMLRSRGLYSEFDLDQAKIIYVGCLDEAQRRMRVVLLQ